jgi:hypothetical protein
MVIGWQGGYSKARDPNGCVSFMVSVAMMIAPICDAVRMGLARGLEVWTENHRGCGLGRGLAKGSYHCGVAGDLGAVFTEARHQGSGPVLALGFSLSGNALLLNLGDGYDGPHPKPDRAIAVNPPVNLGSCSHLLGSATNRPYDLYFVNSALNGVRNRESDGLIPKGRYPLIS